MWTSVSLWNASLMVMPQLEDLLKYENKNIILRYQRDYPQSKMPANQAFSELLKFIWLGYKHKYDISKHPNDISLRFTCVMHSEMIDIDNMWHTFLLFTKDYHDFCDQYFAGVFFHHAPLIETDDTSPTLNHLYETELSRYLSYIYDNLGEATLKEWFKV